VTLATIVVLGDEDYRLVVSEGEILDTDELPADVAPSAWARFCEAAGIELVTV
jgi:hypothetical protein